MPTAAANSGEFWEQKGLRVSCGERQSTSFNVEHRSLVKRRVLEHSPGSVLDLAGRIGRWQRFVGEVEVGYDDSIYDFEYQLDGRSVLQYVIERVPADIGAALTHDLSESDQRFKLATTEIGEPIRDRGHGQWWWVRIPRVLLPELADDLRVDGLIP